jgi:ABC-type nitrate/sulfonate/bicarbonate transport system substrate-binding protein
MVVLLNCQILLAQSKGKRVIIAHASMSPPTLPLWIAAEKGFYAKEKVDVTLVFVRGSPVLLSGMASDEIQAGYTGGTAVLSAASRGLDLQIVANTRSKLTYDIVTRPDVKKPTDLRGKVFGVQAIGGTVWMSAILGTSWIRP